MTVQGWAQIILYMILLVAIGYPLGITWHASTAASGVLLSRVFGPVENLALKAFGHGDRRGQDWKQWARSILLFSLAGWLLLYLILRTASIQPWNDYAGVKFHAAPWNVTFNTVSSFVTNTNWQYYGGETTLTYFSQMIGLTVQNFVSAAVGIVVAVALIRGIVQRSGKSLGNFYEDLVRTVLYVLLPIAFIAALVLASQGVLANISHYLTATGPTGLTQTIAQGPVASQEAIKELGTNGGGFFNVNSAHPFENPTGFTNFFELLLVLSIPVGLVFTYGKMVGSKRQGWAIFAAMGVLFFAGVCVAYAAEAHGSPAQHAAGLHTAVVANSTGGNLEGKEQRFGIAGSALFDVVTTVTSCGAVNSAVESYTGLGGAIPMANLSASEVIFGGVGTGLYSMLLYVLLAVFIGGLMVGRTPELLGKKVEAREIKLVSLGILITPLAALLATALAVASKAGTGVDLGGRDRTAGLLRELLRLPVAGQQQWVGLRRPLRLRPAQRGQRRFARHHLGRSARRLHDALRALRADPVRARGGRQPGRQAGQPGRPRHDAHRQRDLRRPAARRGHPRRRAHVLPRAAPRPDRAGPDPAPVLT